MKKHSSEAMVWVMGFVGSLVYFIKFADSFGAGVLGVLKAFVWPAIVVYKLLGFLS